MSFNKIKYILICLVVFLFGCASNWELKSSPSEFVWQQDPKYYTYIISILFWAIMEFILIRKKSEGVFPIFMIFTIIILFVIRIIFSGSIKVNREVIVSRLDPLVGIFDKKTEVVIKWSDSLNIEYVNNKKTIIKKIAHPGQHYQTEISESILISDTSGHEIYFPLSYEKDTGDPITSAIANLILNYMLCLDTEFNTSFKEKKILKENLQRLAPSPLKDRIEKEFIAYP
jgi:hypothetical protein